MLVSDFSRFILPEVVGCPDPVLHQAIVQTAFEFCDRTGAWSELLSDSDLYCESTQIQESASYLLPSTKDAIALRVTGVWINGVSVTSTQIASGLIKAGYHSAVSHDVVTITPAPKGDFSITFKVVFAPKMSALSLPDMMARYERAISAGAKARLMLMPNTTWTNPQLAVLHRQTFDSAVTDARIESVFDRVGGSIRIQPIRFA